MHETKLTQRTTMCDDGKAKLKTTKNRKLWEANI